MSEKVRNSDPIPIPDGWEIRNCMLSANDASPDKGVPFTYSDVEALREVVGIWNELGWFQSAGRISDIADRIAIMLRPPD